MTTAELLADALDTLRILGWAFAGWLAVTAAIGTIVVLAIAATGTWAVKAVWRRSTAPSWARSRLRARIHARTRTRGPSGRTGESDYDEAA